MSLKIFVNHVWGDSAQLKVTDSTDAPTTDTTGLQNIVDAQRWQYWTSGSTADRRIAYINKQAGIECTHAVLARADKHFGHQIIIHSWSNYPVVLASIQEYNSGGSFNPTLLGPRSQDYVFDLTAGNISGKHAMTMSFLAGSGGLYTKVIHSLYFTSAYTLTYPGPVQITPLSFPSRYVRNRQAYLVDEQWTFTAQKLSLSEVQTFEGLYRLKDAPLFVYDVDGTLIPFKLLHGMMQDCVVSATFDNHFDLSFTILALRQWS